MQPQLLIADADPVLPAICRTYFQASSIDVATAENLVECLRQLDEAIPDIFILNGDFPYDQEARILLQAFCDDDRLATLPVVLTHRSGELPEVHCANRQIIARLEKPFRLARLREVVFAALNTVQWQHSRSSGWPSDSWKFLRPGDRIQSPSMASLAWAGA